MKKEINDLLGDIKSDIAVMSNNIGRIQEDIKGILSRFDKYDERIRTLEDKSSELSTRLSIFTGLQILFSTAVSAIASFLGGRKI